MNGLARYLAPLVAAVALGALVWVSLTGGFDELLGNVSLAEENGTTDEYGGIEDNSQIFVDWFVNDNKTAARDLLYLNNMQLICGNQTVLINGTTYDIEGFIDEFIETNENIMVTGWAMVLATWLTSILPSVVTVAIFTTIKFHEDAGGGDLNFIAKLMVVPGYLAMILSALSCALHSSRPHPPAPLPLLSLPTRP